MFLRFCLQDWALGVLHAKIIAAITLMGPQWWLKTVIEQVWFRYLSKSTLCILTEPPCLYFIGLSMDGFNTSLLV